MPPSASTSPAIDFAIFEFVLEAQDTLRFPRYMGSALRGAFGAAFRQLACGQKHLKSCSECILTPTCPYAYVFETSDLNTPWPTSGYETTPRPFVIEPPLDSKNAYHPGEELVFKLLLFGKARPLLPYFGLVFEELGHKGIGLGRGKFSLREVRYWDPLTDLRSTVYSPSERRLLRDFEKYAVTYEVLLPLAERLNPKRVAVKFETMTRVKSGNHLTGSIDFNIFMRALLRRANAVAVFHCGFDQLPFSLREWLPKAQEVRTTYTKIYWVDWERYSNRQQTFMKMGGFLGEAVFDGDLAPFAPLLVLGSFIHIGKGTVFGLGKYSLISPVF